MKNQLLFVPIKMIETMIFLLKNKKIPHFKKNMGFRYNMKIT